MALAFGAFKLLALMKLTGASYQTILTIESLLSLAFVAGVWAKELKNKTFFAQIENVGNALTLLFLLISAWPILFLGKAGEMIINRPCKA